MALQLNWTDNTTGVTYNNAYAVIDKITYEKSSGSNYDILAHVHVYKDSTAYNDGLKSIGKRNYTATVSISSTDTAQNYRNIVRQAYLDMKQNSPWDTATDV